MDIRSGFSNLQPQFTYRQPPQAHSAHSNMGGSEALTIKGGLAAQDILVRPIPRPVTPSEIGVAIKRFPTIRARATACAPKAGRGQNAWNLGFFAHGARMVVCTIVHSAYHTWGSTHAAL